MISDYVVNQSDLGFHLVLTALMTGLAAGGWWLAGALRRRRGGHTT